MVETWDENVLLFNPASGETHLLNPAALALLEQLSHTPASDSELERSLLPENADDTLKHALNQQLQQLEMIGLICRTRTRD